MIACSVVIIMIDSITAYFFKKQRLNFSTRAKGYSVPTGNKEQRISGFDLCIRLNWSSQGNHLIQGGI